MPVIAPADATEHHAHGSTFSAYVSPSRGSVQLCAWRVTVPTHLKGAAHRPTREEVLLVIKGDLTVTVDGRSSQLNDGDVVLVPAGSELCLDGGTTTASLWVTTTPGIEAILGDGSRMSPPWAS